MSGCILFDEDCFVVARSLYVVKIRISIVLYNSSVNTCSLFLGAACQQTVHDFLLSSLIYSHLATASVVRVHGSSAKSPPTKGVVLGIETKYFNKV